MAAKKDYYKIMGLTPLAKESEIKQAYKKLIKEFHPDLHPDSRSFAEQKTRQLTEANKVLSSRKRREEYDNSPFFQPKVPQSLKSSSPEEIKMLARKKEEKKESFWDKIKKYIFVQTEDEEEGRKLTPEAISRFSMGYTYIDNIARANKEMLEMAKIEFQAVLQESPRNPESLYNMGLIEYKLGNYDQAIHYFSKARQNMKNTADADKMIELLRED